MHRMMIQLERRKDINTIQEACLFNSFCGPHPNWLVEMKRALFLCTRSDSTKAKQLTVYLQGKLGSIADLRTIKDVLAEDQKLKDELPSSDCVVLIGSREASSLIHNKRIEIESGFETFDGKLFHKEFTENKDLQKKLVIVFFTERTKNDWIPPDFDEKRILHLEGGKIRGNPDLYQIEYCIKEILIGKDELWYT